MRILRRELFLISISVLLCLLSLFIPKKVDDRAELSNNKLGFPIHFVVQDSSGLSIGEPDSPPFPYRLGLISIWNYPTDFYEVTFCYLLLLLM